MFRAVRFTSVLVNENKGKTVQLRCLNHRRVCTLLSAYVSGQSGVVYYIHIGLHLVVAVCF